MAAWPNRRRKPRPPGAARCCSGYLWSTRCRKTLRPTSQSSPAGPGLAGSPLLHHIEFLVNHDIQYRPVGGDHALGAQLAHVLHGLLAGRADNAVGRLDVYAAQAEQGGLHCSAGGGGQFKRAAGFGAVADNAGQIADNVLDGAGDVF